jgi:hypothetical protein
MGSDKPRSVNNIGANKVLIRIQRIKKSTIPVNGVSCHASAFAVRASILSH